MVVVLTEVAHQAAPVLVALTLERVVAGAVLATRVGDARVAVVARPTHVAAETEEADMS